MTLTEISRIRLFNQKISAPESNQAVEIFRWMGAMQAQDFPMAKWAVGIRLPDPSEKVIEKSLDKGDIIRTHLLRPTWHFAAAQDVAWMLKLSAPRIKSAMKSREKQLELSEPVFAKSEKILEKSLLKRKTLTREEISSEFEKAGIKTGDNRLSHILARAELDGLICSGPVKAGKPGYALLADRIPSMKTLTREESLVELARRYFQSRGPATIRDFTWWSGLSQSEARQGLEPLKTKLISETLGSERYWMSNPISDALSGSHASRVHLLPAYDEFFISYHDRSAAVPPSLIKKTISDNGIFRPVILIDGKAAGLWKRTIKKDKVTIGIKFFQRGNSAIKPFLEKEVWKLGNFLGMDTEIEAYTD